MQIANMAYDELPDFDALLAELVGLESREREISAERRRLHARLDKFPSEVAARRERIVSDERRALHARIDELRLVLRPVLGVPDPPARPPRLGS
jgi:hypothetical protein